MTNSGNDRKAPPGGPKRPAPAAPAAAPAKPQPAQPQSPQPRVGGSAVGGAAAGRPLPQGARPQPPGARPQPPSRPLPPVEEAEPEAKTTAINLADLGLDSDEATVSVDAEAIRAKASQRPAQPAAPVRPQPGRPAPAATEDVEEKTTAFRVEDLPPHDEEPKRPPQKTLLGHPAPKPGAAVRGAPAPAKRQETVALAKAPIAAAPADDHEATTAMNMDDMLARIETDNAKAKAPAPEEEGDEKTSALSLDDFAHLEAGRAKMQRQAAAAAAAAGGARPAAPAPVKPAPAPVRPAPAAKPAPVAIGEEERTMAISLEDMPAPARRAPAKAAPAARAPEPEPVEDEVVEEEVAPLPRARAKPVAARAAPGAAKAGARPAAKAAGGGKSRAPVTDAGEIPSGEGFVGAIRYALAYGGLEAQMEAGVIPHEDLDPARKKQGFINLIIVGGSMAVLMTVFAFL